MGQKEETEEKQERNNFAKGSIVVNILKLAVPMTLAQLINVLYNIVDRLYIVQASVKSINISIAHSLGQMDRIRPF